jgi:hypothetical protein
LSDQQTRRAKHYIELYGRENLNKRGGFFQSVTRRRLTGMERQTGSGRTTSDFWYKVRIQVETALLDLQLFIDASNNDDRALLAKVVNRQSIEPIIRSLLTSFDHTQVTNKPRNANRAKIAWLLIEQGLRYLRNMNNRYDILTDSDEAIITNALQLSKRMTASLLPDFERRRFFDWGLRSH